MSHIESISISVQLLRMEYNRVNELWANACGVKQDSFNVSIWYIVSELLDEAQYLLSDADTLYQVDAKLFLEDVAKIIDELHFYK